MEFSPLITRTMKIKLHILPFFLLLSFSLFAQETVEKTTPLKPEIKRTYLDSIKKTFVKDDLAACVDSLWLKELTNLDIYSNLTEDIQTINIDEKVDYELPTDLLKARLQEMDEKSPFHIEYNQGLVDGMMIKWDKTSQKYFASEWDMGICVRGEC